jgi:hypothetical protein
VVYEDSFGNRAGEHLLEELREPGSRQGACQRSGMRDMIMICCILGERRASSFRGGDKVGSGGVRGRKAWWGLRAENLRGGEGGRNEGRRTGPEREGAGRYNRSKQERDENLRDVCTHLDSSLASIVGCMGSIVGDIISSPSSP